MQRPGGKVFWETAGSFRRREKKEVLTKLEIYRVNCPSLGSSVPHLILFQALGQISMEAIEFPRKEIWDTGTFVFLSSPPPGRTPESCSVPSLELLVSPCPFLPRLVPALHLALRAALFLPFGNILPDVDG